MPQGTVADKPHRGAIPETFWQQFEDVAAHASPVVPRAKAVVAAEAAAQAVKPEVGDSAGSAQVGPSTGAVSEQKPSETKAEAGRSLFKRRKRA